MTLADLAAAFVDARTAAAIGAVFPAAATPPRTCRYCGKTWITWGGSKLDGHARCVVGIEFQREVLALYSGDPALTVRAIAAACGVTPANVQAWFRRADRAARSST